jgi:extradiol dioxygenase family protein
VTTPCFHLSLVTDDLDRQRRFYIDVLGCSAGRTAASFEDFDFFGHQLTFHRSSAALNLAFETLHFGAVVSAEDFEAIHARLVAAAATFVIAPQLQAAGTSDARRKMVFLDPSGYAVELKSYQDSSRIFAPEPAYPRKPAP